MKPYVDIPTANKDSWFRTFEASCLDEELVWHRDKSDRKIEVIHNKGWKFQRDNDLPNDLVEGQILVINRMEYHRLIKGQGPLIVKITENENV